MSSEDAVLLREMVDFAHRVRGYVEGMTLAEFETNQMKQDAVTYRVGVIGEAARNVSTDTADAIDLDWRGITGCVIDSSTAMEKSMSTFCGKQS